MRRLSMNAFMSVGSSLRGAFAFSHARTSSRNVFSDSLRSKSTSLRLGHRRHYFLCEQSKRVAVVEQEVLQHEKVDAELRVLAHLLADLFWTPDKRHLAHLLQHLVGVQALQRSLHLPKLCGAVSQLGLVAADDVGRHDRTPDGRWVAPDVAAALFEHFAPLSEHLRIQPGKIPLRRLARDQRKRALGTLAAHQERDRISRGPGVGLLPDLPHCFDAGFEAVETLPLGEEGDVEHPVLVLVPTGSDAE